MDDELQKPIEMTGDLKPVKLAKATFVVAGEQDNPWLLDTTAGQKAYDFDQYNQVLKLCRFYYKTDSLVSTVINKLVEIGINDIVFSKNGLSDNEFRVYPALKDRLTEFAGRMAQEYLISGLVVPEIGYGRINKDEIKDYGVKKYDSLILPVNMFLRDPASIKIDISYLSDQPSYFILIPETTITFIKTGGRYPDGKVDVDAFKQLKLRFPDFVKAVLSGETEILIPNRNIIRSRYLSDSPYPIPHASASLSALQQKRNLRRMDFSIMQKVIRSILHVKIGSDLFPVTDSEEDIDYLDNLRAQLNWRFAAKSQDIERIFQFITNHTVSLEWITPDTQALLDVAKYQDINKEILDALGFPQLLISGETARSNTSNPELASASPVRTMEYFRRQLIKVIRNICNDIAKLNGFKTAPDVSFKTLNMHEFKAFVDALNSLYATGGLSRQSFGEYLGYDFYDEFSKREQEQNLIDASTVPQVGVSPFGGNGPQQPANQPADNQQTNQQNQGDTGKNPPPDNSQPTN